MPAKRKSAKKANVPQELPGLSSPLALMERMMQEIGMQEDISETNEERAQMRFYDAMEAKTPQEMTKILEEVLRLDPENVDARLKVLGLAEPGEVDAIESLRDIVETAARKLGPEGFAEYKPHFWGFLETRPYMRARQQLAAELESAGRLEAAVKEYEGMLELNPNDNQGVRYSLLACYLALDRRAEARALIKRYPDDVKYNPVFAWGVVLLRYLTPRKTGLVNALTAARKQNSHIEAYLKGHRRVPKNLPHGYSLGSKEEAICYAGNVIMAWHRHHEVLGWLVSQK